MTLVIILVISHIVAFAIGGLVFRNNLSSVNKLISSGQAIVDSTGKIIKKA
jgi:hypothetical protein